MTDSRARNRAVILKQALGVVEAALDWVHDMDDCHFCGDYRSDYPIHGQDCPLCGLSRSEFDALQVVEVTPEMMPPHSEYRKLEAENAALKASVTEALENYLMKCRESSATTRLLNHAQQQLSERNGQLARVDAIRFRLDSENAALKAWIRGRIAETTAGAPIRVEPTCWHCGCLLLPNDAPKFFHCLDCPSEPIDEDPAQGCGRHNCRHCNEGRET